MVFVTLAIGEPYVSLARELASSLSSVGNEVIVLTSSPSAFSGSVISLKCPEDGTPIWHWKRHAVRAGLERSDEVIFIDSDYQLIPGASPIFIPPRQLPHGFFSDDRSTQIGSLWFDKSFLDLASRRFGVDWRLVNWWGCSLFAISDHGKGLGKRFVDFWDEFACWVRDTLMPEDLKSVKALPDCAAIAFAARAAEPKATIFERSDFFTPITKSFRHLRIKGWEATNH